MLKSYKITLKNGLVRDVTRNEPEGKSLIGLWNWSLSRVTDILITFEECTILSSEIAMIEKSDKGVSDVEEKAKDYWENVEEQDDLAAEPSDHCC
jgi:hypothetical protein